MEVGDPEQGIDMYSRDRIGIRFGDLFDVDAPLGAHHPEIVAFGAIEQEGDVVLRDDVPGALHQHAFDGVPLDVHPQDLAGDFSSLIGR